MVAPKVSLFTNRRYCGANRVSSALHAVQEGLDEPDDLVTSSVGDLRTRVEAGLA
jgi:hypothetical protein